MRPEITEFSYGYALTDELIHNSGSLITAAPVFPTLYEEGKVGGYDVMLKRGGIPLFLQFKLSEHMKDKSAKQWDLFNDPYYRMSIWPRKQSKQHALLLAHEKNNNEVYYSAPGFHLPEELNQAYLRTYLDTQALQLKI